MKIIISSAKRLDLDNQAPTTKFSKAFFEKESQELINILKKKTVSEIKSLMKISPALAQLNYERYAKWQLPFNIKNAKQALFMLDGDVFKVLKSRGLEELDFDVLQNNLRILSGLHGILKPLDLIQAHRLEGGTRLETTKGKNLYEFWGSKITNFLNNEFSAEKNKLLVNLASGEYFKYIKKKELDADIVNVNFKEFKNNKLKTIVLYTKRARGMMLHYITKNRIENAEDLKGFDYENYMFSEKLSDTNTYTFIR